MKIGGKLMEKNILGTFIWLKGGVIIEEQKMKNGGKLEGEEEGL